MAEIRPFRGLRYNNTQIMDLAPVLCPPYDVLSIADQQRCYEKSPYNIIRLEQALVELGQPEDKYLYSSSFLKQWRDDSILCLERQPAFYLHLHRFFYQGREWLRRGIIARVRLEGKESGAVRPHEGTLSKAKDDRLRLLRACHANISPIFTLYEDKDGQVTSLLLTQENRSPEAIASVDSGESHKLWAITEPRLISSLQSAFKSLSLYIADGHHRYETALNYRDERRRLLTDATGEEPFDFAMVTLVSASDPGLLILPVHRLVKGLDAERLARLEGKLKTIFDIEEYTLGASDSLQPERLLQTIKKRSQSGIAIGLYGLKPKTFVVLSRKQAVPVELMPAHTSPAYRGLGVTVLRHIVMEDMLGLEESQLSYTPHVEEALGRVDSGEYQLAFLLNAMEVSQLKAVADAGEKLPGKSTYFYPKLPTGLVIYPLD